MPEGISALQALVTMKSFRPLLQAGVLVLLVFSTPSLGDELKNWLDKAEKVSTIHEPSILESYSEIPLPKYGGIVEIKQLTAIKAAEGDATESVLVLYSGAPFTQVVESTVSSTNYLPWDGDVAFFRRLDHDAWGSWFITAPLTGCDVWIAGHPKFEPEPLLIHINANKYKDDPLQNLIYKQNLALQVLTYFNEVVMKDEENYYSFRQRVSYDYANGPGTSVTQRDKVNDYWNEFTAREIPYIFYLPALPSEGYAAYFYGTYETHLMRSAWNFVLKDLGTGKTVKCSPPQTSCNIM